MKNTNWTRRTKGGIAIALAGAVAAGALIFGSSAGVSAQTTNPPSATASPSFGAQRGPGGRGAMGMRGQRGIGGGAAMTAVAKALGIDEATLRTELQAGKTIADLAKAKNIDTATIVTAIVDAEKVSLTQAVTDGKLTQAQADAMLANAQTRATDMVNGAMPTGGKGGKGGIGGRGPGGGAAMTAVAKALSTDEATLRTELQAGKSVADLAKAKGVDTATIVTAIVDAEKAALAQAVTDGKLTQAQADVMLANAQTRATDMVNGVMPQGRHGGKGGQRGPGAMRGPGRSNSGTPAAPPVEGQGG